MTQVIVLGGGYVVGSYNLNPIEKLEISRGEMGKYLLPEFMGKGLGKLCTQEFVRYILRNSIVDEIYIKTLIGNKKNQHVNEAAGFHYTYQDDKYAYMSVRKEDINIFKFRKFLTCLF